MLTTHEYPALEVGDVVLWEGCGKHGKPLMRMVKVVHVLKSNADPVAARDQFKDTHTFRLSTTRRRVGITYMIERYLTKTGKPALYWPRMGTLTKL